MTEGIALNYAGWYARASSDPEGVDYAAFRRAYAASEYYPPVPFDDEEEALGAAIAGGEWDRAAGLLDELLPRGYARARLHSQAVAVYRALNDPRSAHHAVVWRKLIESVLESGDGTLAAPWIVFSVEEEYAVLEALDLALIEQSLRMVDARSLDRFLGLSRREGSDAPVELYFDATAAVEALGRLVDAFDVEQASLGGPDDATAGQMDAGGRSPNDLRGGREE